MTYVSQCQEPSHSAHGDLVTPWYSGPVASPGQFCLPLLHPSPLWSGSIDTSPVAYRQCGTVCLSKPCSVYIKTWNGTASDQKAPRTPPPWTGSSQRTTGLLTVWKDEKTKREAVARRTEQTGRGAVRIRSGRRMKWIQRLEVSRSLSCNKSEFLNNVFFFITALLVPV